MAGMVSIYTYLKYFLGFRGVFDLDFLLFVEIWHDVQKGSGSTLSSMSFQNLALSPTSSEIVDLCPNIWWNNSEETFLLGIYFCDFDFSFVFSKHACFCCAMCDNVTAFCSFSLKKNLFKTLYEKVIYIPNSLTQ